MHMCLTQIINYPILDLFALHTAQLYYYYFDFSRFRLFDDYFTCSNDALS
jgi:hypothetical protein